MSEHDLCRLLVVCPSRGRPDDLVDMVRSVLDTTSSADVAVYTDEDDIGPPLDIDERVRQFWGPRVGPVASANRLHQVFPGYSGYLFATDDCRLLTPGWDRWALAEIAAAPGGVVVLSPSLPGIDYLSFPLVSGRWASATGWIAYPRAYHFCWDTIVELLAEPIRLVRASADEFSISHPNHTSSNLHEHFERDARSFLFWAIKERRQIMERLRLAAAA